MDGCDPNTIDRVEFERLFLRYKPRFVIIARSYVRQQMAAEDIVTDCFISYWEKRDTLSPGTNPLAYIMTSVRNRCLNALREQSKHLKAHKELHATQLRIIQADIRSLEACDPQQLFSDEVAGIIKRRFETMPERMRNVLVGIRFMGKSYAEVAEQNGITVRQAEYELRKATAAMRDALHDYWPMAAIWLSIIE